MRQKFLAAQDKRLKRILQETNDAIARHYEEARKLREEISHDRRHIYHFPSGSAADDGDDVDNALPEALHLSGCFLERAEAQKKAAEAARLRIRNETYGICGRCGSLIPEPRLEAQPAADHCIECAARLEKQEKEKKRR